MPEIRPATLEDMTALLTLMRAYYAFDHLEFNAERAERALHTMLHEARGAAWLLCDGGTPLGYAVVVWSYSLEYGGLEAVLDELYLEPAARGAGCGSRLTEHVAQACKDCGAVVLRLETEPDNESARVFYRRLGFEPLERVLMKRELTGAQGSSG
jgi:ribosomal protein S18 acetylase RimI-like enzyme